MGDVWGAMSIFPYIRHDMRAAFFRREQVATQQHITLYIQQSNKFECELCESAAPMMVKSASQLLYVKTKSSGKLGVFPHQNGLCTFSSFSNKKWNTRKIEHGKKENTKTSEYLIKTIRSETQVLNV